MGISFSHHIMTLIATCFGYISVQNHQATCTDSRFHQNTAHTAWRL